jgi:K+-transporting ATPase, c chain
MRISMRVPRSITFLLAMTVLLGVAYPALVTVVAQLAFPKQANGSLESIDSRDVGSELLAQKFESPRYFQARPSATDYAYIGAGATNLGPTSAALAKAVADRQAAWEKSFGGRAPREMLYASGSGLDPDISVESALAQLPVVAAARKLDTQAKVELEKALRDEAAKTSSPISAPRVNVVRFNILLRTDPRFAGGGE